VQPVTGETITTDTTGLEAGEVKIPVTDGDMPAYRAQPAGGKNLPMVLVIQEIFVFTSTSRTFAAAWPSSVIWPLLRSFSPGKATSRRLRTSKKSSRTWYRRSPTHR